MRRGALHLQTGLRWTAACTSIHEKRGHALTEGGVWQGAAALFEHALVLCSAIGEGRMGAHARHEERLWCMQLLPALPQS